VHDTGVYKSRAGNCGRSSTGSRVNRLYCLSRGREQADGRYSVKLRAEEYCVRETYSVCKLPATNFHCSLLPRFIGKLNDEFDITEKRCHDEIAVEIVYS
jgi:hypothetical protein